MAMRDGAGTPLDPANLWGKPDPRKSVQAQTDEKKEKKTVSGIDADLENDGIDVDAALDADAALEADIDDTAEDADYENEFEPEEGDDEDVDDDDDDEDDADAELEETESAVVSEDGGDETAESTADEAGADEESPAVVGRTTATSSRKRKMTDKKTSLSDHIRSEIARRQEAGEELRGKDIVASLASRRIKVSPAQVSQILKKEGLSSGTRGRKPKAAAADGERTRSALKTKPKQAEIKKAATPPRVLPKVRQEGASRGFNVPMTQLQAAESFVEACGGSFQNAERILTAAAQLSQAFAG
jgi:hypothetical protein